MEKINLDIIRQQDITELAISQGFERDKYDKKAYHRDGLKISIDEKTGRFNSFTDNSVHGIGAIDFIMRTESMNFKQAIEYLSGTKSFFPTRKQEKFSKYKEAGKNDKDERKLIMPEKADNNEKAYNYLQLERKIIDKSVLNWLFASGKAYEDTRGNVVFVCSDVNGKQTGAEIKNKNFKGMALGSDRDAGAFFIKSGGETYNMVLCESAIDTISYAILKKQKNTIYISLNGLISRPNSFILSCLEKNKINRIVIAFDNDVPGQNYSKELKLLLEKEFKGLSVIIDKPTNKDWNEDLQKEVALNLVREIFKTFRDDVKSIYDTKTDTFIYQQS